MTAQSKDWVRENLAVVALILGILVQTAALGWWMSSIDNRVSTLEKSDAAQAAFPERIKGLETAGDDVARRLDRIELKIDRILEERAIVRENTTNDARTKEQTR